MVPTIGVMIGAYIFLRCLEIFSTLDRVASKANRAVLGVVCVGVILVTALSIYDLVSSGTRTDERMRQLDIPGLTR